MSKDGLRITSLGRAPWDRPPAALDQEISLVLLDRMAAYVVVMDAQLRYTFVNREFLRYVGKPADQVLGRTAFEILGGTSSDDYAGVAERLVAGEGLQVDGWHDYPNGRLYLQETLLPFARAGEPVHTICAFSRDLTALKLHEHDLAQKVKELEAAAALKAVLEQQREALRRSEKLAAMGSLLAGVAHELNNPLAIAMGRAAQLEEHCTTPELRAEARRIREATERCGRIVRTFLNMARDGGGRRAGANLNEVVASAAELLHYVYHTHGIALEQRLDPALPALEMDADQVGQVIMNLLVNAQQALADHEGPRRVTVTTGTDVANGGRASRVWLRVFDSGPGVAPELRERIFETLFTTKAPGLGTGLGLSLSRSLARAHDGDLSLEPDAPGRGASFLLTLPLTDVATNPAAVVRPAVATNDARQAFVLIVDDEPELCDLMREMLEDEGFQVATATSAHAALERLGTTQCDAIVSDMRMPDMDGPAFWREVSTRHPRLKQRMLFASGDTLSRGVREFIERCGCLGLPKPFARADLLAGVRSLLRR